MAATAVLASAVAGTAALAPQATAATRAAAYNGVCGSGYKVVNSAPIGQKGTVYLTYNATKGKNCVVTVRNAAGSAVPMFAYVYTDGGEPQEDSGYYTSYAGPVYLAARGKCVDWAGGIDNQTTWTYGSNCGSLREYRVTKGW
ncbi:spore-associated protein A [Streptomyces sp. NPDC097640]|uniref:spore-associated protein A n=1 Tax=Streptomyces sp. NPDC097640 TaxID=3157229 RepID=UPI003332029D